MTLKEARIRKGTQREIALAIGVTETTIRNIENGRSKPSLELAFTLSVFLGIDMETLWVDLVEQCERKVLNTN
ncbi:helix-turn-helix transcriptional regulator [Bacillus sp. CDB3]|uniref:helix-turn-helix transcriptional regulator n=1 Tax=Bacillus sp. CDB3 TaxID=360310 RepID=UPI00356A88D1